jgi:hypothetical protein
MVFVAIGIYMVGQDRLEAIDKLPCLWTIVIGDEKEC